MPKVTRGREEMMRITLSLSAKSMQRLDSLVEITEASSRAEVLRNALRLYEVAVISKNDGGDVLIKEENGKETSVFSH